MSEELTIKIKKENIWKYSTFVLAAVVIVGIIWIIAGKNTGTGSYNAAQGNQAGGTANSTGTAGGTIDPSVFSDTSLYPALGPATAKSTVIEIADFQCPYCALAAGLANWTTPYASQYGDFVGIAKNIENAAEQGQIRFIYVPANFLGQESVYATEAALCANKQGKFWEMHDAIFAAHDSKENNGKYTKNNLEIIAKTISGLDQTKFKSCLENDDTLSDSQTVESTVSQTPGQPATPSFFVNGQKAQASWSAIQAQFQ